MIFINHFGSGKGAKEYFAHLSRGDYFAEDAPGLAPTYDGELAKRLGIAGQIATKESFYALCENQHPVTGERLTARTKEERRPLTDVTFDVPKSVTLAGLVDDRIDKAMDDAVRETMREMEREIAVRVRKGGKDEDRVTGNLLYVIWPHETGRPLEDGSVDPQKHRHVTVMNMSYDATEKAIKAAQWGDIVRDKGFHQAAYHARLASKLEGLGYRVEKDGNSFRLEGISKEMCETFSRRTAVIEKAAAEKAITNAKQKGHLGRLTRNKKGDELSTPELRAEWFSRMTPDDRASLHEAKGGGPSDPSSRITADRSLQYAIDHVFERVSTISERRLKAEALRFGVGSVRPEQIDVALHARRDIIRVKKDGQVMVTTQQVLHEERAMLAFARDGQRACRPLGEASEHLKGLSAEQGAAALHVLGSRDRVVGIRGGAGTGKTTTVKAIVDGIEQGGAGVKVFGFAPSASASRGTLRQEGLKDADTLERLLRDDALQKQVRGQVLLVDEAGLISTRDMGRLFKVAEQQQARVILTGDYLQHGGVQAGDAFRLLESEAGVRYAQLREIRRQKPAGYKQAVAEIAKGTRQGVQKGFELLDKAGAVVEVQGETRHQHLVHDYLGAVHEGRSALIIAPARREGDQLTASLREALKAEGTVGTHEHTLITRKATGWTAAQKSDARNYEPGMVVEFHQNAQGGFARGGKAAVTGVVAGRVEVVREDGVRATLPDAVDRYDVYRAHPLAVAKGDRIRITKNDRTLKVNNGDLFTVEGFTKSGDLKVGGDRVVPKTYGHLALGYVDTSYASQGKTVDRVFIAAGDASVLAVNAQQFYVSVSRGRESARLYVDSKQDVRDAIAKSGRRLAAVELLRASGQDGQGPVHPSPRRRRVQEFVDRNRVLRYVRDRVDAIRDHWRRPRQDPHQGVSYA